MAKSQPLLNIHIHTHRGTALQEVVTFSFQCVALEMLEGHPCGNIIQEYVYTSLELKTEKAMAPHSSTLAWKIPWTEEPARLQSMGSLRVGHD